VIVPFPVRFALFSRAEVFGWLTRSERILIIRGEMKRFGTFCLLVCVIGGSASVSTADLILSRVHTWDLGTHGWTNEFGYTALERELVGGDPNGWLKITFPATGVPEVLEDEWYDVVHVSPANLLVGPGKKNDLRFDFIAQTRLPQDLQLQFHAPSGNVWGYSIADRVTQTGEWTDIAVPMTYSDNWGGLPGFSDTLDQFVSDLASMDWIGVYIWRDEAGQEEYGIDNFRFLVPEPEEYAMLAMAMCTILLALRRRQGAAIVA